MRVLAIVHQDHAGPGVFGDAVDELVEWWPAQAPAPQPDGFDAVMTFGGAMNADQEDRHPWLRTEKDFLRRLLAAGVPTLGVCLGCQLVAEAAGAPVRRAAKPEIGWRRVEITHEGSTDPLVGPLAPAFEVFQWHSYEAPLPPGAVALAHSGVCLQAFRLDGLPAWGLQFHAEVTARDLGSWLDDWQSDPDAVASGQDPEQIRADSEARIATQNERGRELAGRFLAAARENAAARA
jgi:GMP synthase-like glutamine amidotransferase